MSNKTALQIKLKAFRTSLGLNQTEFAQSLDISQAAIANMESGNRDVSKPVLIKIANVYGKDLLSSDTQKQSTSSGNIIPIPFYSAKASAGVGEMLPDYSEKDVMYFDKRWLQNVLGVQPDSLSLITATGDSMFPLIHDGDLLMVDSSAKNIINNKIFVIEDEGNLRVKRLKQEWGGDTYIISENPKYSPEKVSHNINIIGKVVWNGNREIA